MTPTDRKSEPRHPSARAARPSPPAVAALALAAALALPAAAECPATLGDLAPGLLDESTAPASWTVTGDGAVNTADVVTLMRVVVKDRTLAWSEPGPHCAPLPGDYAPGVLDGATVPPTWRPIPDGAVTVADVVVLLRSVVGLHVIGIGSPPAFPGAEGFGARASGGRGGAVLAVTTLADSGPGSLRAALEAVGPRTVVFRVAGEIVLQEEIRVRAANSDLTVAGQSAPGDGITLRNVHGPGLGDVAPLVLETDVRNVVLRGLRFRPGPSFDPSSNVRGLTIRGRDIIVDHCSFSWATDEIINIWDGAANVTIQWSIIAEGLDFANHPDTIALGTGHSRGLLFGGTSTDISFHHDLVAHVETRGPRVKNGRVDVVNTVNYGQVGTPTRLDNEQHATRAEFNYVGNFVKRGPESTWDEELKVRDYSGLGLVSVFVEGNIGANRTDDGQPQELVADAESRQFLVDRRHPFPPVTTTSARVAYEEVLARAGASVPSRDAVDERIVADVRAGTGGLIDHPSEVGGWPPLAPGSAPPDGDGDGMPDAWEIAVGLDPADPADAARPSDLGYTLLEVYLNGLFEDR